MYSFFNILLNTI